MIKWIYYSKYLKQFLFGLLISCFMVLGGVVSAVNYTPIDMTSQLYWGNTCTITSNLWISCDKSNSVMSSYSDYLHNVSNIFWTNAWIWVYYASTNNNRPSYQ